MNDLFSGDIPMGFGMALAENLDAMQYFSNLPRDRQQSIIAQTKSIASKEEMQRFVNSLKTQQS